MGYRKSVITFLDILGFQEIVNSYGADDISKMLDAVSEVAGNALQPGGERTEILSFSDSIIRMRPTKDGDFIENLIHEVRDLAWAQWSLMEHGILVRGGTTIGEVLSAPGRAFGPGFVRAYKLESSLAGAPRIVIDPAVVENIRAQLRTMQSEDRERTINLLRIHLRHGDDGLWCIDYIASVTSRMDQDPGECVCALQRFRNTIIAKTNGIKSDSLVLPKYLWLIRYHNASVARLFSSEPSLKIRITDVPASDEFLKAKGTTQKS